MSDEQAVLLANEAFYRAFSERDQKAMRGLWATETEVVCIHPGWAPLESLAAVMESWGAILGNPDAPLVRCRDARVNMIGDVAVLICYEVIGQGVLVATNMFVRERGNWKMVHHQAGPAPSPTPTEEPNLRIVH